MNDSVYLLWQRVCERLIGHDWVPRWVDAGTMATGDGYPLGVDILAEDCSVCHAARLLISPRVEA